MKRLDYYELVKTLIIVPLEDDVMIDLKNIIIKEMRFKLHGAYECEGHDNRGLCKQLMMVLHIRCKYWKHNTETSSILYNIKLLEEAMRLLGSDVPAIVPRYSSLDHKELRSIYIDSIMPAMAELYVEAMVNHIKPILTRLDKGEFDGLFQPFDLDNMPIGEASMPDLYSRHESEMETPRDMLEYLLVCFTAGVRYHAGFHGTTIPKFEKLIKFETLLRLTTKHELDIYAVKGYLEILMNSLIGFIYNAKTNPEPENERLEEQVEYHIVRKKSYPDICEVSCRSGLMIQLHANELTLYLIGDYQDEPEIATAVLYGEDLEGYGLITSCNLYNQRNTTVGKIVIDILKDMDLLELFLQELN